jgi:hypothetical protein
MLVFKAQQIVSITAVESNPYDFSDDSGKQVKGVSHAASVTAIGTKGVLAVIKVKGKTPEEAALKLKEMALQQGKPAEIPFRVMGKTVGAVVQLVA